MEQGGVPAKPSFRDRVTGPWPYAKRDENMMTRSAQRVLSVQVWIVGAVIVFAVATLASLVVTYLAGAALWSLHVLAGSFMAWLISALAWFACATLADKSALSVYLDSDTS